MPSERVSGTQEVLFPACTYDYRVTKGKHGFGIVANRRIKKGEMIFSDSLEYSFSDVVDGDRLLFDRCNEASKKGGVEIPRFFPLTRDTLMRTHGVPSLVPDPTGEFAGIVSWQLEVPGMLMNHSCDPNIIDFPPCSDKGEGYAARDIKKGEEMTCDYCFQYYDEGPLFKECNCGAPNCRGEMMGFKALRNEEKERFFPFASEAVKAMHRAEIGQGPLVKKEQTVFPERMLSYDSNKVVRLVFPGPGVDFQHVAMKQNELDGNFGIFATKDFNVGEKVYEFWCQIWPQDCTETGEIDMVFGLPVGNDPPEGTTIRLHGSERASRFRGGMLKFTGWDMLAEHSCEPNLAYDDDDSEEEEDWRAAYATRHIKEGERLTIDYNCVFWDRSSKGSTANNCNCGADNCAGTRNGFKFISRKEQRKRKLMSSRHVPPPCDGEKKTVAIGKALSANVRVSWRKDPELGGDAPDTDSSGSSSSDDSSTSEESWGSE